MVSSLGSDPYFFIQVVGERWGSLGELTVSVASNKAAQSRAHLHAIKSRQKGLSEEHQPDSSNQSDMDNKKVYGRALSFSKMLNHEIQLLLTLFFSL